MAGVAGALAAGGCAEPDDPVLGRDSAELVVDQTLVPFRATWSYWDRGGDLGVVEVQRFAGEMVQAQQRDLNIPEQLQRPMMAQCM